ncbi:MAG: histidine phosphatase family protein, partial [Muribaculaceae bacterium]|nr:histidine phosphatase family protein [Muribaculaceae bacterium]
MKISRIVFPLFLLVSFISVRAGDLKPFPAGLDGSMMPYDFSATDSLPDIPEGYVPVHVSYVARHGARYLSSPKKIEKIEGELRMAEKEERLSPDGEAFLALLKNIADSTGDRWGLLSPVGLREEQRLGREMAEMFPDLLRKGKAVAVSTFVPRVIMTMYEFNHALERRHTNLELYTSSGHQNDSLLYFFDVFSGYRDFRDSGAWEMIYDDFVERHVSAEPARRLFNDYEGKDKKLRKLTMEMYGALQGNRAAAFASAAERFFTQEEYRECYRASNLKHYLRNTPNHLDPYCAAATAMLINRIISD